jgi:putative peptidoglycan lipid II flippase
MIRVALTSVLGYIAALHVPQWIGVDQRLGLVGLTATAGFAGWVEFFLLRRGVTKRIGPTGVAPSHMFKLWLSAILSAGIAWGIKLGLLTMAKLPAAVLVVAAYGAAYLIITTLFGIREATAMTARVRRRRV